MHLVTGEVTNRWGSGPFNSIIVRAGSDPFIPTSRSPYSRGGLWDPWNHVSSLLHPESLEVSRSFPTVQLFAKITGSFEEELKNHYGWSQVLLNSRCYALLDPFWRWTYLSLNKYILRTDSVLKIEGLRLSMGLGSPSLSLDAHVCIFTHTYAIICWLPILYYIYIYLHTVPLSAAYSSCPNELRGPLDSYG